MADTDLADRGPTDPPGKEAMGWRLAARTPASEPTSRAKLIVMLCIGMLLGTMLSEALTIHAVYVRHGLGVQLTICKGWWGGF